MISIGGGKNSSSSQSYVWDDQSPFLNDLYTKGQNVYDSQAADTQQYSTDFVKNNAPALQNVTNGLQDLSFTGGIKSGDNLGMGTMSRIMDPNGNPYLDGAINSAMGDIGRNLNENILMNNESEAGLNNQFGSSRQSIADGMAKKEALRLGNDVSMQMRNANYATDQNRSLDASKSYVNSGLSADELERQKLSMVGGSITDSYNLGMTPANQAWDTLNNYQSTIGGPTVLNSSSGSGWNISGGFKPPA